MFGFEASHPVSEQNEMEDKAEILSNLQEIQGSRDSQSEKEVVGTDVDEVEFEEKQNNYEAKIEELIATCSDQEVVKILNDFDLDIKNESTKGDCVFDQDSSQADTNAINGAIIEVDAPLETRESVEKLLGELLERRKEYEGIINFFLATRKPDQSDIN